MKIGMLVFIHPEASLSRYKKPISFFRKAVRSRGHSFKLLQSHLCDLMMTDKGLDICYAGKPFPKLDCIIPRINSSKNLAEDLLINKQLMLMNIPVLNDATPFANAKNKIATFQILVEAGLPVPKTVIVKSLNDLDAAVELLNGLPLIVKTPIGSQGKGVAIVETRRSLLSSIGMIMSQGVTNIILQEYIEESQGQDLRIFVVGGNIIAAMERTAVEGDFRSNIHQGGKGANVKLTKQESDLALRAAAALKLDVAGVDLLRSKRGPLIMEVNCNPGLEGITAVSGVDVAGEIIDFLVKKTLAQKAKKIKKAKKK